MLDIGGKSFSSFMTTVDRTEYGQRRYLIRYDLPLPHAHNAGLVY